MQWPCSLISSQYTWDAFCLLPSSSLMFLLFWVLIPGPRHIWQTLPTHHSPRSCYVIIVVHFNKGLCLLSSLFCLVMFSTWCLWIVFTGCNPVQTQDMIYWDLDEVRTTVLHHGCDLICHHTKKSPQKACKVTDVRVSQTYCLWNCKSSFTRQ